MSKADRLGAGRFGGGVRPVSARRQAVAAATGVPTDGVAPPSELPVHRVSPNPDNPRSTLGDLTDLAGSLQTHGQKQAITVMNRDAYVKANPAHESALEPDTTYVVVDGSSRLAAAREAGLATIKVMVSDDQGSTSEELLESALVANIHRQDLEELDEARALQRLLAIHGSQRALAKRLHRSQGWVSQRLALLHLTPELQARIGEEPIDLLRAVGNKPAEEQEAALEQLKQQKELKGRGAGGEGRPSEAAAGAGEAAPSDYGVITDPSSSPTPVPSADPSGQAADASDYSVITPRAGREGGAEKGSGDYGVITGRADSEGVGDGGGVAEVVGGEAQGDYDVITRDPVQGAQGDYGVITGGSASAVDGVPEPRGESGVGEELRGRPVPFDQPGALAMLLNAKVGSDELFFDLLRFLSMRALERDPARLGELAEGFVEAARARADG
ncbi:ParB/RepB/Spo0J family partition protein [Streptomyces sp. NPDC005017]|uniref:ParB/RepB/Spo0J family partition protein n=1 Tax=Streptomyces sp. NPDC005017 TaxID=3364706 RepID=UPI0036739C0A